LVPPFEVGVIPPSPGGKIPLGLCLFSCISSTPFLVPYRGWSPSLLLQGAKHHWGYVYLHTRRPPPFWYPHLRFGVNPSFFRGQNTTGAMSIYTHIVHPLLVLLSEVGVNPSFSREGPSVGVGPLLPQSTWVQRYPIFVRSWGLFYHAYKGVHENRRHYPLSSSIQGPPIGPPFHPLGEVIYPRVVERPHGGLSPFLPQLN
jgi:hypothetical protein